MSIDIDDFEFEHLELKGIEWNQMESKGIERNRKESYGTKWNRMQHSLVSLVKLEHCFPGGCLTGTLHSGCGLHLAPD